MTNLPEPFTPIDCDLRGLQYMPLFGDRLFGSTTWISASTEARCAALRLWWRSYAHEVPAASLPDNEALLAEYAGYGTAIKAFRKVRDQAMAGWVKCSDGRLYHKMVAEIALESWVQRLRNRFRQEKFRAKRRDVTVTERVTKRLGNRGAGNHESSSSSSIGTDPAREAQRAEGARLARSPGQAAMDDMMRNLANKKRVTP